MAEDTAVDTSADQEAERSEPAPDTEEQAPQAPDGATAAAERDTDTPGTSGAGTALEARQPDFEAHSVLPSAVEWANLMSVSKVIANSGLAPKVNGRPMSPEAVAVTALKGRELGIPPMMALSHIHVIEGRPTASAELMRSLVQRAGHYLAIVEQTPQRATANARRKDWPDSVPTATVTYTREEADEAGLLGKSNWKKHPVDMLVARVTSRICRQLFADCLMGASYTPDELEAEVDYTVEGEIESVTVVRGGQQQERPADDGSPITDGQKRKLSVQMKELGIRSDGSGGDTLYRAGMEAAYGVDSISGLTKAQASTLIEVFERGRVNSKTGEISSPEEVAAAFLSRGSQWLAEQEEAEQAEGDVETDENGGEIVDAELVEDGDDDA
jgi:hypothetical protein